MKDDFAHFEICHVFQLDYLNNKKNKKNKKVINQAKKGKKRNNVSISFKSSTS